MGDFVQPLDPGMGMGVANRTVFRESDQKDWGKVAERVALGNTSIIPCSDKERIQLERFIKKAVILMSGRHLQHGDENQANRIGDTLTNCATSAFSFLKMYMLLNGSGVGRSYDDDMMIVDWRTRPIAVPVLGTVPDCVVDGQIVHNGKHLTPGTLHPETNEVILTKELAFDLFPNAEYFLVPDSREGWAEALEQLESRNCEKNTSEILILDFSAVRPEGALIGGMQDRPSSGPVPLMQAFAKISEIQTSEMEPWEQNLRIDHEFSKVVLVGGVRRAARIATKWWKDPGIFEFINIKQQGDLWTANNSVAVDGEFWALVKSASLVSRKERSDDERRAYDVFDCVTAAQYFHGTGEPGFINVDKLQQNDEGFEVYNDGVFIDESRLQLSNETKELGKQLVSIVQSKKYKQICNPCSEISLNLLGGYCVLGDLVPYFANSLDEVVDAATATVRALIRTNQMSFLYDKEVKRTNRIGVSLTGVQEFAWKFFGMTFRNLLNEDESKDFWYFIARLRDEVVTEAKRYSKEIGANAPHTALTFKPSGSVSKLFSLTEGAHLPAMLNYLRWVQFRESDPLVFEYEMKGYPVRRNLKNDEGRDMYEGMAIVGFPTRPLICRMGIPENRLVIAPEASLEDQFKWVGLLEKHWLGNTHGNQVSYSAKYKTSDISFEQYCNIILNNLPNVRCISLMPSEDWRVTKAKYSYIPEEPIAQEDFDKLVSDIKFMEEAIDMNSLQCASGACPL